MSKPKPVFSVEKTEGDAWVVAVDGQPVLTPTGNPMIVPCLEIAECITEELTASYGMRPVPPKPHFQLANTAIDLVDGDRESVQREVMNFATTELLCYRANHPRELAAEQEKAWQPWLDWCAERYGIRLHPTTSQLPVEQPADSLRKLELFLASTRVFELTLLRQVVDTLGSLVLGLAVCSHALEIEKAVQLSELDQSYQAKRWGDDPEHQKRRQKQIDELTICAEWFGVLGSKDRK